MYDIIERELYRKKERAINYQCSKFIINSNNNVLLD